MIVSVRPEAAPLRIAQVSPLFESVPPQGYGGTERVVSYLTEELVRMGHDVTLYASGDSDTSAELVPVRPRSLRLDPNGPEPQSAHVLMLERVFRDRGRFDIVHFHFDSLHFALSRRHNLPHVTTMHGRLDSPDIKALFEEFSDMPVVSISNAQRRPLSAARWVGTVYHGHPRDLHTFRAEPGRYLAFLGRISPEKGVAQAIDIARRVGRPLKIAAKVDNADCEYFHEQIKPLLEKNRPLVEFLGEVAGRAKDEFLGGAAALLFPIDWPEPFGLVMIEALACGTPVIAFRRGSVPEVLDDGVTGFVVDDVAGAVAAVGRLGELSRARCREVFEQRFSAGRMAADYVRIYRRIAGAPREAPRTVKGAPSVVAGS